MAGAENGCDRAGVRQPRRPRRFAPRPEADVSKFRHRTLQYAGPCGGASGGGRPSRRQRDVQSALHPRRRRSRQNPSAASRHMGGQCRHRAQSALPHGGEVHVWLRRRSQDADGACFQGSAPRHRRSGHRRLAVPARQIDTGRILPHVECAHRCGPPGRHCSRPAAVRPGKPRRSRTIPARRRARGRNGFARRGASAWHFKSRVEAARTHHASFDVPEQVLDYLAKTITHNGRDLEGAINRLLAHSKLNAQPVTLEMAEREVRDLVRPQEPGASRSRTSSGSSRGSTMSAARTCCLRAAPPMWCGRGRSQCISPKR